MQYETMWIVLAAVLILVELWAINRVRKSEGTASTKGVWMVVIVFVPLLGLILWAFAGPKHVTHNAQSAQARH
ncbi:PLD nuclease N-terminal domain-containing protein [Pseudomonas vancouverensis]|uniref:PLDc_N domain-containing protein n=1 Tax=Pseudomonas vancouverensis TaxID=95300 RepID=A0A1H2NRV9_PSEVA|nr:PLD nuclease N-terminal domain-containing protein [Pseudomonas vancouverensis]KAB0491206.1 PLDc_N domain-containing protein [Pseudomonas vancouverensis]TDB59582.1 PLDc_N domain-containing protein [Pseudomonas vancouverensis]SDV07835.1 Phospholipase_D-nuclease N-terminal [Pseudomonas vancouverensis]